MLIGGHVSIAGGFDNCIERSVEIGGNCLQTFASSPRSLADRKFTDVEIEKYLEKKSKYQIQKHFLHAVYLVNLASSKKDYLKVSTDSVINYQLVAGRLNAVGTILHIGSHLGLGFEAVAGQVVATINFILDSSPKDIKLILENAAGQSGTIGTDLRDLSQIISRVGDKSKIGICLDTQHAYSSGYDLNNLLTEFDRLVGHKYLSVIHLNDSLTEFNSHRDRHANWGEGQISIESLKKFITDPRIKGIPLILEVPGDKKTGPRKKDIDQIKSLVVK